MTTHDTDCGAGMSGNRFAGVDACGAAAGWLGLAAAPVFAIMALATGLSGGDMPGTICGAGHGASPLGGMVPMYLLMAAFHLAPWLTLAARRSAQRNP